MYIALQTTIQTKLITQDISLKINSVKCSKIIHFFFSKNTQTINYLEINVKKGNKLQKSVFLCF